MDNDHLPRRWWRDPAWWKVVVAAVQLFAIGFVGAFIGREYKTTAEKAALVSLRSRLAAPEPETYQAAFESLFTYGSTGIIQVIQFMKTESDVCTPWRKARFLEERILSASESGMEAQTRAIRMLWSSWLCHRPNIGSAVELYEVLKRHPEIACQVIFEELKNANKPKENTRLSTIELITVLKKGCPQHPSDDLAILEKELGTEMPVIVLQSIYLYPWTPHLAVPLGPFKAEASSWADIVEGTLATYKSLGPSGVDSLWGELQDQPILTKLILAEEFARSKPLEKSTRDETIRRLTVWVNIGLHSRDAQTRFAAVTSIGNLGLRGHGEFLKTIAESDEDASVRDIAAHVLAQVLEQNRQ